MGGRAIYPRVDPLEKRLRLFEVVSIAEDLTPGTLGILEPAGHCREVEPGEVDWVLVPGLAFDERRFRLGRGAGHYDRLLPRVPATSPKWAIALEPQIIATLPSEPHDIPVDGVLTPSRVIERS
jgi:5-formyltetrahydrofolate cyclo-ligase